MPKEMQPAALTACAREWIAYHALKHGSLGNKVAHFVYPTIERDTKAGCSIASDYASVLFYKRDLQAIEILEKALKLRRKAYGDKDGRTIWALLNLAIPYRESGQYQKSIDCANEVIKDFEGQPLCEEVVSAYRMLISNYSEMQDYKRACATAEKLVALEEGESPIFLTYDYEMLSYRYRDAGQLDKRAEMERKVKQIQSGTRVVHPSLKDSKIKVGCKCSKDDATFFNLIE